MWPEELPGFDKDVMVYYRHTTDLSKALFKASRFLICRDEQHPNMGAPVPAQPAPRPVRGVRRLICPPVCPSAVFGGTHQAFAGILGQPAGHFDAISTDLALSTLRMLR